MSSLQTVAGSKNYVSIFPAFISRLSEVAFFNWVDQMFIKTMTCPFFADNYLSSTKA